LSFILVLHGPNLNLLGTREESLYGSVTLEEINNNLKETGKNAGIEVVCKQSNHEGELIDFIQEFGKKADYVIINPAAYTHTSIGIRDALLAVNVSVIEVHMTNIYKRESFRHNSYIKDISIGQIIGFGPTSYYLALEAIIRAEQSGGIK
jgi:3-dehydroquinate dehydratase-2